MLVQRCQAIHLSCFALHMDQSSEAQCSIDMQGGIYASVGHEVLVMIVSAGGCRR